MYSSSTIFNDFDDPNEIGTETQSVQEHIGRTSTPTPATCAGGNLTFLAANNLSNVAPNDVRQILLFPYFREFERFKARTFILSRSGSGNV